MHNRLPLFVWNRSRSFGFSISTLDAGRVKVKILFFPVRIYIFTQKINIFAVWFYGEWLSTANVTWWFFFGNLPRRRTTSNKELANEALNVSYGYGGIDSLHTEMCTFLKKCYIFCLIFKSHLNSLRSWTAYFIEMFVIRQVHFHRGSVVLDKTSRPRWCWNIIRNGGEPSHGTLIVNQNAPRSAAVKHLEGKQHKGEQH